MAKVLIIGAGGVSNVVVHKCAQLPEVFSEIVLASRTESKCKAIAATLNRPIKTAQVDADNVPELVALINAEKPDLVINVALPYQDLHIMDACLATGVDYLDTANYEPLDTAKFEYSWQWAYQDKFKNAGITALLGSGFDPGVTNVYTAYLKKHHFDEIHYLDIIDCNAGDHGLPFATNFNPEINIREVTANGRYWENGDWVETPPLSVNQSFDFPAEIGPKKIYMMYHEELESIVKHLLKRFGIGWVPFSERIGLKIAQSQFPELKINGIFPHKTASAIPLGMPILIVHSKKDKVVPIKCSRRLYIQLRQTGHYNVYFLELSEGLHGKLMSGSDASTYQNVVHAFYKRYNLPHEPFFAQQGEPLLNACQPSIHEVKARSKRSEIDAIN